MGEPRVTIGEYLNAEAPPFALWQDLLDVVFRDSPNSPRLERVGPTSRTVFLVRWFGGQVINGGLRGFLANASGAHAAETLDALRQIGASISAELLERALSVFPDRLAPRDECERQWYLFPLSESARVLFDELEGRIYRDVCPIEDSGRESLDELLLAFMRDNDGEGIKAQ
jgi:hypothetical protein